MVDLNYIKDEIESLHKKLSELNILNKNVIDIVHEEISNELDRWVPFEINYKRYNVENFLSKSFKFE